MDFLRDPFWQFIGAILAIVAIGLSIILYLFQRRRKALTYNVISRTPLLSIMEEVRGKIQIFFDNKLVSDAHMVILKIINSGNVPILPSDFQRPVMISFGEQTQILSSEIIETNPDNVEATLEIQSQNVVLRPVLLNSNDSITIKALLSQFKGKIEIDGRIVGVSKIQITRDNPMPVVIMGIGLVLTMVGFYFMATLKNEDIGIPIAFIGYLLGFISILSSRKYRKTFSRVLRSYADIFERLFKV